VVLLVPLNDGPIKTLALPDVVLIPASAPMAILFDVEVAF
jgi:hypothetical protein